MWIDYIDGELDQILDFAKVSAKVSEIPVIRGNLRAPSLRSPESEIETIEISRNPELPCQCLPHSPGAGNPGCVRIKNLPEPGLR